MERVPDIARALTTVVRGLSNSSGEGLLSLLLAARMVAQREDHEFDFYVAQSGKFDLITVRAPRGQRPTS